MKNPKQAQKRMQAIAVKMFAMAEEMEKIADESFSSDHPQIHEMMEDQRKVIMKQVNEVENTSFKINMMTNNWF
tara:strand:- start:241 stop:462 length:222 start_codon:yes stop_codon:yes gene_type:complete